MGQELETSWNHTKKTNLKKPSISVLPLNSMDFIRLVKILIYSDHSISVTLMLTAGLAALEGNNSLTLNSLKIFQSQGSGLLYDTICQLQSNSKNPSAGS